MDIVFMERFDSVVSHALKCITEGQTADGERGMIMLSYINTDKATTNE